MTEIKFYKSSSKGLKIFVWPILFAAMGIWLFSKSASSFDNIIAWVCVCLCGLGIALGLFQTLDRRPQIIIDENGIWDRTTNGDEIKWEQIKAVYPLDIYEQKFVSLVLDDNLEFKKKLSKWGAKITEEIGAQKINLLMSQLKIDEHKITSFINEIIKVEREKRQIIIKKYFDN
ncbi:MAG: hypothetical protein J0I09_00145 [Sphingobacteriia bacterium]|nr:hypothetical protein [Sphingobacteriia bacterium]